MHRWLLCGRRKTSLCLVIRLLLYRIKALLTCRLLQHTLELFLFLRCQLFVHVTGAVTGGLGHLLALYLRFLSSHFLVFASSEIISTHVATSPAATSGSWSIAVKVAAEAVVVFIAVAVVVEVELFGQVERVVVLDVIFPVGVVRGAIEGEGIPQPLRIKVSGLRRPTRNGLSLDFGHASLLMIVVDEAEDFD